jgi:hypothetical protein
MEKIGKHNYEAFWLDHIEGNLDEAATMALFAFLEKHPELKPDLIEFDSISIHTDMPETEGLSFSDKQSLKHIPEEIEENIVAYLEGQLSGPEKAEFENEIAASPERQKLLADYRKTILSQENRVYPAKMQLKKPAIAEDAFIAYIEGQMSPEERTTFEAVLASDETARFHLESYEKTRLKADTSVVFPDKKSLKREAKVVSLFSYRSTLSIAASIVLLFGLFWLLRTSGKENSLPSDGSIALKKIRPLKKQATDILQNTQIASSPGIHKTIKQQIIQKDQLQPDNKVPQSRLSVTNNTVPPVDTMNSRNHTNRPENKYNAPVEPRSLIALNPYTESESDPDPAAQNLAAKDTKPGPGQYVAQQINKAAWGEEDAETKAENPPTKKVKGFDVLALIGKGLKKLGNQRSDAKKIESEDKDYTEYIVTIGSLSVSKKTAN